MMRKAAGLAIALLLATGTSSCDRLTACPALAWMNSLTVSLDGNLAAVGLVELCADGTCSVRSDAPATFPVTPISPGARPVPASSAPSSSPYSAARVDEGTWRFSLRMRAPAQVIIRVLSPEGTVLAERELELDWARVDSSPCGGPATAGPITLTV
jgi:hypothetical protein